MSAEEPPVVFDTVVLSNFAASDSLDWLCGRFRAPRTVGAVGRELRRGRAEGYTFVERAIDALATKIMVSDTDEAAVEQFSEHVDTGEAEALAAAARLDGIVATDDGTARELARERDISFTGSVGIIADGVRRGELDAETADRWLAEWIRTAGYYSPIETVEELL
jgi:predicted nucleic acid-binding protein